MKRRLTIIAITTLAVVALITVVLTVTSPAHAGRGAEQIAGTATEDLDACLAIKPDDVPKPEIVIPLLFPEETEGGYLRGCLYSYPDDFDESPSGTIRERGHEIFVGDYVDEDGNVVSGRFETTYLFTAKFDEDGEVWGRCQHPIIAGTGKGDFEGVTGRFDVKDNPETGEFFYKGHLRFTD